MVEYREIKGFEGYRVGNDGTVWSALKFTGKPYYMIVISDKWKKLKPYPTKKGHLQVSLRAGGVTYYSYVHRLVLEAFIGKCPNNMECCHNDGNPRNNSLENLRWDTSINNVIDKEKHGTQTRGDNHCTSKLTQEQVDKIRKLYSEGKSQTELGKLFNVDNSNIYKIVNYITWRYKSE